MINDSPLSSAMVAKASNKLAFPRAHGDMLYWQECLASEESRWVVRCCNIHQASNVTTLTPQGFAVSSKVHEYGGIAYGLADRGLAWVSKSDQGLYFSVDDQHRLLFQHDGYRFAEPIVCDRGVIAVAERQTGDNHSFPENFLVWIDAAGRLEILHQGCDFYAAPTLSPCGQELVWLSWNMPHMPWQQTTLWRAVFHQDTGLRNPRPVQAVDSVALFQPQFSPSGELFIVEDSSGFGRIKNVDTGELLGAKEAEHGLPLWQLGMRTYTFCDDGRLVFAFANKGAWLLADREHGEMQDIAGAHVSDPVAVAEGFAAYVAWPDRPPEWRYWRAGETWGQCIYRAGEPVNGIEVISPVSLHFAGTAGEVQGYFYAPKGDGMPPVIIKSHGGPSGQTDPSLNLKIQFWVSRGFAVFDINYSGSTGFGRVYMDRLQGTWGELDVDDCLAGLDFLIVQGLVNKKAAFISGSSAGGLTTLGCLVKSEAFAGGVSAYGVADLAGLAAITHKFEARYLDGLVGTLPEQQLLYQARSPLYHAAQISVPVLFLQGGKDVVVPPEQTHSMIAAIKGRKNAPEVRLVEFPEEGHGFRDPQAIIAALEAELAFYQECLKSV